MEISRTGAQRTFEYVSTGSAEIAICSPAWRLLDQTRTAMRAIAASAILLAATPAFATSEIVCTGEGVSIDLLVGSLDVLSIARAVVTIGEETWSTQPDVMPGTPITVGQGFQDDRQLVVDLTDDAVNEVLGRLRVVKGEDGDRRVAGGVFTFKGKGAFVVDCSALE